MSRVSTRSRAQEVAVSAGAIPCDGGPALAALVCEGAVEWPLGANGGSETLHVAMRLESAGGAGAGVARLTRVAAVYRGQRLLGEPGLGEGGGSVVRDAAGLWHVQVPGMVCAVLRGQPWEEPELLYASTPLLAKAGVGEGQVDRPRWVEGFRQAGG